ncbi:MAG: shikimate dehydrogenase [Deltaproteobacteria bacterium]
MRRLLAVIGRDVSQSLSPRIHRAAADALSLDVAYVPISVRDVTHFGLAVDALRCIGALGANVTIPYKAPAFALADNVSNTARQIGAVNTLTFASDGRIQGDNTDGPGLLRVLSQLPPGVFDRVQILGSGGAAKAAAWAVAQLNTGAVHVTARRGAEAVADLAGGTAHPLGPIDGVTLVISAIPGDGDLAKRVLEAWVDDGQRPIVCDLAYGGVDRESPLALLARSAGLTAFDGRAMLAEQGALSLSLWTGGELARIREAMRASLALPPHFDSHPGRD